MYRLLQHLPQHPSPQPAPPLPLYDIQIQDAVVNHGAASTNSERCVVFICEVLHNILRSQYSGHHGGQQPEDDDVVGDGHVRNQVREAKCHRDYLRDYFNNEGAVFWGDYKI